MEFQIGTVRIPNRLVLAPMAGVSDAAFRAVCREMGAGYTVTEMVSARALEFNSEKTVELMLPAPGEKPFAVQIFGHEPDSMARAAEKAVRLTGADVVDINMGCPVGKIVNNGDGSALMRDPELAASIVEKVRQAVDRPVTVKFRKGWDGGNVNAVPFALAMQEAGASAVTVHGRTRVQMYGGTADWDIIREVRRAVKIPVIANGDVFRAEDAVRILNVTGADAVMIGRGAFGNPWIFRDALALMEGREVPDPPTVAERCDLAVRQIETAARTKGERTACLEARKHYPWYLKGIPYAGFFRDKLVRMETLDDVYRITEQIKRELR